MVICCALSPSSVRWMWVRWIRIGQSDRLVLELFTTDELMPWPLPSDQVWKQDAIFADPEEGKKRYDDLMKRVVQHVRLSLSLSLAVPLSLSLSLLLFLSQSVIVFLFLPYQNIRTIAKYYHRVSSRRLAELLRLSADSAEEYLSELVSSKQLFAKIDRKEGVVTFTKKETPNSLLQAWSSDIGDLLGLVEKTCHLINKEYMLKEHQTSD